MGGGFSGGKEGIEGRGRYKEDWGENVVFKYIGCIIKRFKNRCGNRDRDRLVKSLFE